MKSVNYIPFKSNKNFKIDFSGGNISSDSGLLLIKEFLAKTGFENIIRKNFHTTDSAFFRIHKDSEILLQTFYQTIEAYHTDDCSDELAYDPVLTSILSKERLASQPTMSRFFSRMDSNALSQLVSIQRKMRKIAYSIKKPEFVLLDIDSTLLNTYGHQEGEAYNYHYDAHGYHPLLCYDGLTGDLLKAELREGAQYCSNGAGNFLRELLNEYEEDFPEMSLYCRGDSGFASPEVYDTLEEYGCRYAIRLKQNPTLLKEIADADAALYNATLHNSNAVDYAVTYRDIIYRAKTWDKPRRVVCKIEKPYGQMLHTYTFIVTTMEDLNAQQVVNFYCGRGKMENFIKEGKNGFGFSYVSSQSETVNACRFMIHCLAYSIFNWFRRLVLPGEFAKFSIDTLRIKLLKIASRIVRKARYVYFRLCSSCPYKDVFRQTLLNIQNLNPQIE